MYRKREHKQKHALIQSFQAVDGGGMPIRIFFDGTEISDAKIEQWELGRAKAVYRYFESRLDGTTLKRMTDECLHGRSPQAAVEYLAAVHAIQGQINEERVRDLLQRDVVWASRLARMMNFFSGNRRQHCVIEILAEGIKADQFVAFADGIMPSNSADNKKLSLNACPDHYLLQGTGNETMEVIETTGGSPFPMQFFLVLGDETGLTLPRDHAYPLQTAGAGRLKDGTVVGGIRHQFRNEGNGFRAKFGVEFPGVTPTYFIRQHQFHLACEWKNWIKMAISSQQSQ